MMNKYVTYRWKVFSMLIIDYSKSILLCFSLITCVKKRSTTFIFSFFLFHLLSGQTLPEYIKEAKENNPELSAYQHALEVSLEKVNEAKSLSNTKIATGYFVSEPETRTGAQKAKFTAQQEIPWFGTIKARKATATAESEVHKNNLEIAKRKVILQVEKKYYKLYELKARQNVLKKQDTLLDTYLSIAIKGVENNNASAVDVLKLNIAKNNLLNQEEILKGEILTTETAMNQLLHRDGFDALVIPDNLYIPDEEPTMMLDDIVYHPELVTYDHLTDLLDKKATVNTKEALPSIGVGLDYVIVQERPDINFSDNGKDIVMPMLSFSVPLFSKKHSSRTKQYELQKEEMLQKREASQNTLENLMEEAINNRITARINYNTQQKNITQAKQAEEILLSGYQTAQLDFEELLDIQQMVLSFENKKIEAVAQYFMQTAVLNYLR